MHANPTHSFPIVLFPMKQVFYGRAARRLPAQPADGQSNQMDLSNQCTLVDLQFIKSTYAPVLA
eukprot:1152321-Pelagomonas_calceolata.AAC.3